jgi:glyoxylase-like metal-dependent hydrolase (beta-lactamase superfamily II)/rhodanese-related sulfurtransferase
MYVEQIYTNCLAEAAYYVESEGEALIIDPIRETQPYIDKANERGANIKYVLETHFHADFVSGHVDLANKTNSKIIFGPGAKTSYDVHVANDGEEFELGKIKIKVLHTPGHTLESTTYLLIDANAKPYSIFTGDTLFIGDVGRPDLAIKSDLSEKELAGMLYDSLRQKIMTLPDDVIVYPAHGAGSACGKNMSKETYDTLGNQKKLNYALQDISKEEFVKQLTSGILVAPQYFAKNAMINKNGYESLEKVVEKSLNELSLSEFESLNTEQTIVLDVRSIKEFPKAFIPGSLYIGLDGMFATWVGTLMTDIKQAILLIVPEGREEEAIIRLARVGYENVLGYLKGGFETWASSGNSIDSIDEVDSDELYTKSEQEDIKIMDVRKPGEWDSSHILNAQHCPLDFMHDDLPDIDKKPTYYVHCRSGYRSLIAASILKRGGFSSLVNVKGGFNALQKTDFEMLTQQCSG